MASPSWQLAGSPLAGRPKDQQGAHHSCHLHKLGQQRDDSVDDHRQALESTLFQRYQLQYIGRPLSRQCKGMDDPERLLTLATGLWSPDARSPSPPFAGQLPEPHPLREVCGDERGPSQHPRFLLATKHDLGNPTLRCWDHTHIQSVYRKQFTNLLMDGYKNNINNPKKISILDAFHLAVPGWRMFHLPQSPTASAIAKSRPATSSTHNKGKLILPPPLSRSCNIKWLRFHTGIPWTSTIFSTIRRRTTTWWRQMMRTSPTASLRSSAHSRMKTQQTTTTTVWNRQKSAPIKLRSIWRV